MSASDFPITSCTFSKPIISLLFMIGFDKSILSSPTFIFISRLLATTFLLFFPTNAPPVAGVLSTNLTLPLSSLTSTDSK